MNSGRSVAGFRVMLFIASRLLRAGPLIFRLTLMRSSQAVALAADARSALQTGPRGLGPFVGVVGGPMFVESPPPPGFMRFAKRWKGIKGFKGLKGFKGF